MPELACIVCSAPLSPVDIEGQSVLACPTHGFWMRSEQLAAITDDAADEATSDQERAAWSSSDAEPRGLTTEKYRTCPVCANTLRKDNWGYGSGVVVDTCDEHGVWVGTGEIERIERWQEAWETFNASTGA